MLFLAFYATFFAKKPKFMHKVIQAAVFINVFSGHAGAEAISSEI